MEMRVAMNDGLICMKIPMKTLPERWKSLHGMRVFVVLLLVALVAVSAVPVPQHVDLVAVSYDLPSSESSPSENGDNIRTGGIRVRRDWITDWLEKECLRLRLPCARTG